MRREALRAKIRVAADLAIGNRPERAHLALDAVAGEVARAGAELNTLYLQTRAIAAIKARDIGAGFTSFARALDAARSHGEPALCARVLINYGTAATQDGDIAVALACLEEAVETSRVLERSTARGTLERVRNLASTKPVALVSLAEARYAAGDLEGAARALHEFHGIRSGNSSDLMVAVSVGLPLGMLLGDRTLLERSSDANVLDLAFARREQWLLGPIAEGFCAYYEFRGQRERHDALLERAAADLASLDNSVPLALRAARLGRATHLPRLSALMARHCAEDSVVMLASRDLFDSHIAARRQTARRATRLAQRAERGFALSGRPLLRALALCANGERDAARGVARACGATADWPKLWGRGPHVHRKLAAELTAREAEVARFAAAGLTNRAIAERLDLSDRTVQHHCEAIYGKLGIRSRRQLPDVLERA